MPGGRLVERLLVEARAGVLTDDLEHREAGGGLVELRTQEAVVDEYAERVEQLALTNAAHALRGPDREGSDEDAEPAEDPACQPGPCRSGPSRRAEPVNG